MSNIETETLVPLADVDAVGLGVGRRSLGRRVKNPPPGFPTALRINGRLYLRRSELEAYKQRLIAEASTAPATAEPRAA
ncbi:MAG: hypothetical protein ABSC25_17275 [Roseiarcus sp.]|jgi:hypothetical protein